MEIRVFPRGYNLIRQKQPLPDGGEAETCMLAIVDAGGVAVTATFTASGWEEFKAFVADPEGEAARQQARQQILSPNGLAPTVGKPRRNGPH